MFTEAMKVWFYLFLQAMIVRGSCWRDAWISVIVR
jgi:hypothetical protein